MPPPSPTTLRIDEVRNVLSIAGAPLLTTCQSRVPSGIRASANALVISTVATRSELLRRPSLTP